MNRVKTGMIALLTVCGVFCTPVAMAAFATAPTYPEDFCDALDDIVTIVNNTPLLLSLLEPEDLALINSLACATADINGTPIDTTEPPDGEPDAPGPNGMLDGSFELGLIAFALNNEIALQVETRTAYETNYGLLAGALNNPACTYCTLLPALAPGLAEALIRTLAGFATEGDETTLQVLDLLGGILTGIGVALPAQESYIVLPATYGPDGDADADGCSNRAEYNAYASLGAATYVANALDPDVNPGACDPEGEGEGTPEGEGEGTPEGEGEGEGTPEGEGEGTPEGEGEPLCTYTVNIVGCIGCNVLVDGSFSLSSGFTFTDVCGSSHCYTASLDSNNMYVFTSWDGLGTSDPSVCTDQVTITALYDPVINEGEIEGEGEGTPEGEGEGTPEGEGEGTSEGEGAGEGEGTAEGEGEGGLPEVHAADQNGDNAVNLSELLRVIQFYNSVTYGCQPGTEDGYAPNDPDQDCPPHSSDYNAQDWDINLSELLRVIQFYNTGGYAACPAGEDGFCPAQ